MRVGVIGVGRIGSFHAGVLAGHPEVVDLMLGEEQEVLDAVQKMCGRKITVRPRGSFHQEQYDIFGTSAEALQKKKQEKASG